MVVRVVVMDRSDGSREENVLSLSPSVRGAVALVPAPETVVSAVVPSVGALDLGGFCPSCESVIETLPRESKLFLDAEEDMGAGEGLWPFAWVLGCSVHPGDGCFDGLCFTTPTPSFLPFDCLELAGSLWRFLRFARRFIQFAKGRLRACLSGGIVSIVPRRNWETVHLTLRPCLHFGGSHPGWESGDDSDVEVPACLCRNKVLSDTKRLVRLLRNRQPWEVLSMKMRATVTMAG